MRLAFSSLLIVSFFGLAVFSLAGMAMADDYGHADCIATAVQGNVCPEVLGTLGFINFHVSAARVFSTAVFGISILGIFGLFLMFVFDNSILKRLRKLPLSARYRISQFLLLPVALPKETLSYWLSLHEKRDPTSFFSFRPI